MLLTMVFRSHKPLNEECQLSTHEHSSPSNLTTAVVETNDSEVTGLFQCGDSSESQAFTSDSASYFDQADDSDNMVLDIMKEFLNEYHTDGSATSSISTGA